MANEVFIDNDDQTITDVVTGLTWQKAKPSTPLSFPAALQACTNLELGGHRDWRLPEVKELLSIVDFKRYDPAINTLYFPSTSGLYWMQTSDNGSVKRRILKTRYGSISEIIEMGNPYYNAVLNFRCVR
ncbi:Lcl C-terminal domain-containing protein [Arenicella chitinivorans]|nr:DUF1566 domain-containing protein [Arenicella chitinivorans]